MVDSLLAAAYDLAIAPLETLGLARERARLLAGAQGRVLEVGGGTGLNLCHYRPEAVSGVVVCEPADSLRTRLVARAERAPVPVEVVAGAVPGLGLAASSFDTVVCTLVLCSVQDLEGALAELLDVLRPDGRLLFFEHVLGRSPLTAHLQRLASPAWSRLAGGCRLDRDTVAALRAAGFVVTDCERPVPLGRPMAGTVVRGAAIPRRTAAVGSAP